MGAPDRIWVEDCNSDWTTDSGVWGPDKENDYDVDYIRADLVPQWQPIETAPKDGTEIDLWVNCGRGSFRVTNCRWGQSDWAGRYHKDWIYMKRDDDDPHRDALADVEYDFGVNSVTHWQPLPQPPATP